MWHPLSYENDFYKFPEVKSLKEYIKDDKIKEFKGVFYFSLDMGIVWNYRGKEYPGLETWTWATSKKEDIVGYVDSLWEKDFLPIFHGMKTSKEFADKILSFFKIKPPTFIGVDLVKINTLVKDTWLLNTLSPRVLPISTGKLISIPFSITENPIIFRMGSTENVGLSIKLDNITFGYENNMDVKENILLILVGQPGSGKSTVSESLSKHNWLVISEKDAGSIRRSYSRSKSKVIDKFKETLRNIGKMYVGVVIDSTNPTLTNRAVYINIANELGISYRVGFISRPGWVYNSQRYNPVPKIALRIYSSKLQIPTIEENGFRLI